MTKAKQKFARATGIPTTKAGMQRKVGKAVMGGGCTMYVIAGMVAAASIITYIIT